MGLLERTSVKSRAVAGAVAGNLVVTGIKADDLLIMVQPVNVASPSLTSEFRVTADNTINNTGGTSSATQIVLVMWETKNVRRGSGGGYNRSTGLAE